MLSNKKLNPIAAELFIRGGKLNSFLAFITKSYFAVPKNASLNSVHYEQSKQTRTSNNHSPGIDFKGFVNLYKKCTAKPYSILFIDANLACDNSSHFRKNLLERI